MIEVSFHIPGMAPARTVTVEINGEVAALETYPGPGAYTLRAPVTAARGEAVTVGISVDESFEVAGDARELGVVVTALGFVER
jgi:hypothetical protein